MTNEDFTTRVLNMQGTLYRVSCSILHRPCDREDAVQSAIERAWSKRLALRDEARFEGWLTRILINECYTLLRKNRRELLTDTFPDSQAPPDANPDLYRFFSALPDKLRLPMVLHYVEGMDLKEVAQTLQLPLGTVKSRLMRGREKMKQDPYFMNEEEVQPL